MLFSLYFLVFTSVFHLGWGVDLQLSLSELFFYLILNPNVDHLLILRNLSPAPLV